MLGLFCILYDSNFKNFFSSAQTANINDISIVLAENVNWRPGDKIVIASTDYHRDTFTQDEVVTITSVDGTTVQFTPPLKYTHYGKIWQGEPGHFHSSLLFILRIVSEEIQIVIELFRRSN
jgi:hypothetical protein